MNIFRKTGLVISLVLVSSLPMQAFADEAAAPAPAAAVAQPGAQSMQDLMREMRRDPSKCKTMPGAAANADTPAPMPGMGMGMGMGMMGMGPGMNGKNCKPGSGMQGQRHNCHMRGCDDDQRLEMLEKRMDMMQMMMEMMMRSGRN